jgi:hypothetical protein
MLQNRPFLRRVLQHEGHEEHEENRPEGLIQVFVSFVPFVVKIGLQLAYAVQVGFFCQAMRMKMIAKTRNDSHPSINASVPQKDGRALEA